MRPVGGGARRRQRDLVARRVDRRVQLVEEVVAVVAGRVLCGARGGGVAVGRRVGAGGEGAGAGGEVGAVVVEGHVWWWCGCGCDCGCWLWVMLELCD